MSTQWHPMFACLLKLLLEEFYQVEPEVPVSDLPRRGDFLVLRRHEGPVPPFQGLWSNLTNVNVFELKGPSDDPEEEDLEKLVHVGTGITYRLNEERRERKEPIWANRQVSFWYLASTLGETFLGHARLRSHFHYEGGGLWRSQVWGHPVWLLAYRDLPVELDTIPLLLLERKPAPLALGELMVGNAELWRRFAGWLLTLHPELWEEIRTMAGTTGIIDWEAVSKVANLEDVIRFLPPERVVALGIDRAIATVGLPQVIEVLLKHASPEQLQEILRNRQQPG